MHGPRLDMDKEMSLLKDPVFLSRMLYHFSTVVDRRRTGRREEEGEKAQG